MTQRLNIELIRIDGGTQSRVAISESMVSEYCELLKDDVTLPAVIVFFDGAAYWLADGFHRYHAHTKAGYGNIEVEVRKGTLAEAKLFSYAANQSHGLRRTNEDKRKAVQGMLADFGDWSDRAIAKHVGVAHTFVAAIRTPSIGERQKANKETSAERQLTQKANEWSRTPPPTRNDPRTTSLKVQSEATQNVAPELIEAQHTIVELAQEVEQLRDRLAVESMDVSDEAKTEAAETIATLRAQIKTLEAEIDAMRISRDTFQRENAELKKQINSLNRQIKKLEA